jgi:hypothetical protein
LTEVNVDQSALYVEFEGARGERRPVSARPRAPRSGIKVRIPVEREVFESGSVYLLYRRGYGDMVLGASHKRDVLESVRARLGSSAAAYEIAAVPVVRPQAAVEAE